MSLKCIGRDTYWVSSKKYSTKTFPEQAPKRFPQLPNFEATSLQCFAYVRLAFNEPPADPPSPSPPQSVRLGAKLPQLKRPVLTTSGVELPIRREAHAPNRPVVSLVHLQLALAVKVVHPHPRVPGSARHELALFRVQRDTGDLGFEPHGFEELAGGGAGEEVGGFAGGDGEGGRAAEGVELAAADGGGEGV